MGKSVATQARVKKVNRKKPHGVLALAKEMSKADLGDKRRGARLGKIVHALACAPSKSIPQACRGEAEIEATYRLLRNPGIDGAAILEPHFAATAERCAEEHEALVLHDTSDFAFRGGENRKGLGTLSSGGHGFRGHFALAVSADGSRRSLGVLGVSAQVRAPEPEGGPSSSFVKYYSKECKDKEYSRWLDLIKETQQRAGQKASLIHVADREADDYRIMAECIAAGMRFVIRKKHNRFLIPESKGGYGGVTRINGAIINTECVAEREVPLSSRKKNVRRKKRSNHPPREYRCARLSVGATRVRLKRPDGAGADLPKELDINVVRVWEENPPEGEERIEWVLLTSEPINTVDEILRVVDIYRARFVIEEFFKALKTGCGFLAQQLESARTLFNSLAICAPIAWRLLLLRTLSRDESETPANEALTPRQIKVLRAVTKKPLPDFLTVRAALLAIAKLGGHMKSNGWPGWQVLGRGYEYLLTVETGWLARELATESGQRCDQS